METFLKRHMLLAALAIVGSMLLMAEARGQQAGAESEFLVGAEQTIVLFVDHDVIALEDAQLQEIGGRKFFVGRPAGKGIDAPASQPALVPLAHGVHGATAALARAIWPWGALADDEPECKQVPDKDANRKPGVPSVGIAWESVKKFYVYESLADYRRRSSPYGYPYYPYSDPDYPYYDPYFDPYGSYGHGYDPGSFYDHAPSNADD